MRQVVSRGCEQKSSNRLIILFTQVIYLCILLSGYRTKVRLPLSFEKSLNLYLNAKPPKPPAMPCRWFFVFRQGKYAAVGPATISRACRSLLRCGGCAESKHRIITVVEITVSIRHFAALISCCGAGTRFVHLSFRVKSAFLEITRRGRYSGKRGPEITESSCWISQSSAEAPAAS